MASPADVAVDAPPAFAAPEFVFPRSNVHHDTWPWPDFSSAPNEVWHRATTEADGTPQQSSGQGKGASHSFGCTAPTSKTEPWKAPRGRSSQWSFCRGAIGTLFSMYVGSFHFAMGYGWLTFTKALVLSNFEDLLGSTSKVVQTWLALLAAAMFLVPIIVLLHIRRLSLLNRAEAAMLDGDSKRTHVLCARADNAGTVASWGCAFAMAAQLANAVDISLPDAGLGLRILAICTYVGVIIFVVFAVLCLSACFPKPRSMRPRRVMESTGNTIVGGACYGGALIVLDVVKFAFAVDDVNASMDVGFLALFSFLVLTTGGAGLAFMRHLDFQQVDRMSKKATMIKQDIQLDEIVGTPSPIRHACTMLWKMAGKLMVYSGIVSTYALVYVIVGRYLVARGYARTIATHESLDTYQSFILLVIMCVWALVGGFTLHAVSEASKRRVAQLEGFLNSPGASSKIRRIVFHGRMAAHAVAQNSVATVIETLVWLVGTAFHVLALAVWQQFLVSTEEEISNPQQVLILFGYCFALTGFTTVATLWCRPAPLWIASTELQEDEQD